MTGRPPTPRLPWLLLAAIALGGCASSGSGGSSAIDVATEEEWRALRQPRPEPLPGAARVTVGDVDFLGAYAWPSGVGVGAEIGVAELAAAGLLRRRDVRFVERRRFSAAAEAERRGERRRPGQPAAGVSPSVDFAVNATWLRLDGSRAAAEVRLVRLETGEVAGATRVSLPVDADPVTLGRAVVRGTLAVLDELERRPSWVDPLAVPATANVVPDSGVSVEALHAFLRGLAAEEVWNWEGARRGYVAAEAEGGFHEASTALARAARLRLGGTLGEG